MTRATNRPGRRYYPVPAREARRLVALAERRLTAEAKLNDATDALARELANLNVGEYCSVAALADTIGLSKAATHALIVRGR